MTALSPLEKSAGRLFRAIRQGDLDGLNKDSPPGEYVLALWRVVRHECAAAGGASIGITLREHYELSPEYRVCSCGSVGSPGTEFPHADCQGSKVIAAAGQFAWIWKEGKCSGCGRTVRTKTGRFIPDATDRPPDHGRANGRREAGAHTGDPGQPRA